MAKVNFGSGKDILKIQDSETELAIRFLQRDFPSNGVVLPN